MERLQWHGYPGLCHEGDSDAQGQEGRRSCTSPDLSEHSSWPRYCGPGSWAGPHRGDGLWKAEGTARRRRPSTSSHRGETSQCFQSDDLVPVAGSMHSGRSTRCGEGHCRQGGYPSSSIHWPVGKCRRNHQHEDQRDPVWGHWDKWFHVPSQVRT